MKIKAVIFDMDGTLLNTICDMGDCLNRILEKYGFPLRSYDEYMTFVCNGSRKLVERAAETDDVETVDKILSEYKDYYSKNFSVKTEPYEGIIDLVDELLGKGYKLGIYSNKPDNIVKALSEKHFNGKFLSVRGQTENVPVKPSPEGAWLTADEIGVPYEECAFVGDSLEDRLTAANAGMIPVSVSWGYRTGEYLRQNGADICLDSAEELKDWIMNN